MTISNDILITQSHMVDHVGLTGSYQTHVLASEVDATAFLTEHGARFKAVAGGSVNAAMLDLMPSLELIANFGVGYDSVDVEAAKAKGVRVTNTPDVLNDAVAELALGLMLALCRRIPEDDQFVRKGNWLTGAMPLQTQLSGKTVGIYGLGRIGLEIAHRCEVMKMNVVYFGRNKKPDVSYRFYDDLEKMASDCDWLVVMAPGGDATKHTVNQAVLEALGPNGSLVNMARGTVVDEPVLVEMLKSGALGAAALDVFDDEPNVPAELFALDNVVLSSHRGSATRETRAAMAQLVVDNIDAHFAGKPLLTPVV